MARKKIAGDRGTPGNGCRASSRPAPCERRERQAPPCIAIVRHGSFAVASPPQILRWVFIPLALASICALLWPRKATAPNPC